MADRSARSGEHFPGQFVLEQGDSGTPEKVSGCGRVRSQDWKIIPTTIPNHTVFF